MGGTIGNCQILKNTAINNLFGQLINSQHQIHHCDHVHNNNQDIASAMATHSSQSDRKKYSIMCHYHLYIQRRRSLVAHAHSDKYATVARQYRMVHELHELLNHKERNPGLYTIDCL